MYAKRVNMVFHVHQAELIYGLSGMNVTHQ